MLVRRLGVDGPFAYEWESYKVQIAYMYTYIYIYNVYKVHFAYVVIPARKADKQTNRQMGEVD